MSVRKSNVLQIVSDSPQLGLASETRVESVSKHDLEVMIDYPLDLSLALLLNAAMLYSYQMDPAQQQYSDVLKQRMCLLTDRDMMLMQHGERHF